MTVSLMRDFGVDVQVSADKRTYTIPKVFPLPKKRKEKGHIEKEESREGRKAGKEIPAHLFIILPEAI